MKGIKISPSRIKTPTLKDKTKEIIIAFLDTMKQESLDAILFNCQELMGKNTPGEESFEKQEVRKR